jgi:hypothetical protein
MKLGKGKVLQFKPRRKHQPRPQPPLPSAMAMALKSDCLKAA